MLVLKWEAQCRSEQQGRELFTALTKLNDAKQKQKIPLQTNAAEPGGSNI